MQQRVYMRTASSATCPKRLPRVGEAALIRIDYLVITLFLSMKEPEHSRRRSVQMRFATEQSKTRSLKNVSPSYALLSGRQYLWRNSRVHFGYRWTND